MGAGHSFNLNGRSLSIRKKVGEGGYALIYLCEDTETHQELCLKVMRIQDDDADLILQFRKEVALLKLVSPHPSIICYLDHHISRNGLDGRPQNHTTAYLLTDYAPGTLVKLMRQRHDVGAFLSPTEILRIFRETAAALMHLHAQTPAVVHLDVKVENILIKRDPKGYNEIRFVLCDFGSGRRGEYKPEGREELQHAAELLERITTLAYSAPEIVDVFRGFPIGPKADVWALGILLYKLCYFTTPFEAADGKVSKLAILAGKVPFPTSQQRIGAALNGLIEYILVVNPEERPSVADAVRFAQETCGEDWARSDPQGPSIRDRASVIGVETDAEARNVLENPETNYDDPSVMDSLTSRLRQARDLLVAQFHHGDLGDVDGVVKTCLTKAASREPGFPKNKHIRRLCIHLWEGYSLQKDRQRDVDRSGGHARPLPSLDSVGAKLGSDVVVMLKSRGWKESPIVALKVAIIALRLLQRGPEGFVQEAVGLMELFKDVAGHWQEVRRLWEEEKSIAETATVSKPQKARPADPGSFWAVEEADPDKDGVCDSAVQLTAAPPSRPLSALLPVVIAASQYLQFRLAFHLSNPQFNNVFRPCEGKEAMTVVDVANFSSRMMTLMQHGSACVSTALQTLGQVIGELQVAQDASVPMDANKLERAHRSPVFVTARAPLLPFCQDIYLLFTSSGTLLQAEPTPTESLHSQMTVFQREFAELCEQSKAIPGVSAPEEFPQLSTEWNSESHSLDEQDFGFHQRVARGGDGAPERCFESMADDRRPRPMLVPWEEEVARNKERPPPERGVSLKRQLHAILKVKENGRCADCGSVKPSWASINVGVLFCFQCSKAHRNLGVDYSQVRSLTLDKLKQPYLNVLRIVGNRRANSYYEALLPEGMKPTRDSPTPYLMSFVRQKYVERRWAPREAFCDEVKVERQSKEATEFTPVPEQEDIDFDPFQVGVVEEEGEGGDFFAATDPQGPPVDADGFPVQEEASGGPEVVSVPRQELQHTGQREPADESLGVVQRGSCDPFSSTVDFDGFPAFPSSSDFGSPADSENKPVFDPFSSICPQDPPGSLSVDGPSLLISPLKPSAVQTSTSSAPTSAMSTTPTPASEVVATPAPVKPRSVMSSEDLFSPQSLIRYDELNVGEEIGRGAFAIVYKGSFRGTDVAIKQLHVKTGALEELGMLKRLRHPNIVLFMGVCERPLCLVTEYCEKGSLFDLLIDESFDFSLQLGFRLSIGAAKGMSYLHGNDPPIIHRDLKSLNLLVDDSWSCKISDFGLSRVKETAGALMTGQLGTYQWMAPEVLGCSEYGTAADVYSFGVNLFQIVTRRLPFEGVPPVQVAMKVYSAGERPKLLEGESPDPRLWSLITRCWSQDPAERPPFTEILSELKRLYEAICGDVVPPTPAVMERPLRARRGVAPSPIAEEPAGDLEAQFDFTATQASDDVFDLNGFPAF